MALVGSGTSKIKNFYSASSLSSADVDESFAAFAEQIGGVKWANGAPARAAGNLTYVNFASGIALGNDYKRESRSIRVLRFHANARSATIASPLGNGVAMAYQSSLLTDWSAYLGANADPSPVITLGLYVDGLQRATLTLSTNLSYASQSPDLHMSAGSIVYVSIESGSGSLNLASLSSTVTLVDSHI